MHLKEQSRFESENISAEENLNGKQMCWIIFLFLAFIYFVGVGLSFFECICEWLQQRIWKVIEPYSDRNCIIHLLKGNILQLLQLPIFFVLLVFYSCLYLVQLILFYVKKPVPQQISHEINFDFLFNKELWFFLFLFLFLYFVHIYFKLAGATGTNRRTLHEKCKKSRKTKNKIFS